MGFDGSPSLLIYVGETFGKASPTPSFLQDELNFLRNIQIFKKNSAKYCEKYIPQDLMGSIPVRLDEIHQDRRSDFIRAKRGFHLRSRFHPPQGGFHCAARRRFGRGSRCVGRAGACSRRLGANLTKSLPAQGGGTRMRDGRRVRWNQV